jgi:magnesium-transporting ATPase (P-type)
LEVLEGDSSVDESRVTGESMPVSKHPGDSLVGATINKQGTLRARATYPGPLEHAFPRAATAENYAFGHETAVRY